MPGGIPLVAGVSCSLDGPRLRSRRSVGAARTGVRFSLDCTASWSNALECGFSHKVKTP